MGLSIVAIGTSLPELATALTAAIQRRSEIVVGNILGSNIFNILAVIGITAFMQPVDITARYSRTDMWIMLASSIVLVPFMVTNWRLSRAEGVVSFSSISSISARSIPVSACIKRIQTARSNATPMCPVLPAVPLNWLQAGCKMVLP